MIGRMFARESRRELEIVAVLFLVGKGLHFELLFFEI